MGQVLKSEGVFVEDYMKVRQTAGGFVEVITGSVIRMNPSILVDKSPRPALKEESAAFVHGPVFKNWQVFPSFAKFHHEDIVFGDAEDRFGGLVVVKEVSELVLIRVMKHGPVSGKVQTIAVGIHDNRTEIECSGREHFIRRQIRFAATADHD